MNELWNLLKYWSNVVRQAGYEPPRLGDLQKVAAAGTDPWPSDLDAQTFEPWRKAVEFICLQKRLGVVDPVGQLPLELQVPQPWEGLAAPPAGLKAGGASDPAAVLAAWREWAIRERIPGISALRPDTVSKVARDHKLPRTAIKKRLQSSDQRVFVDPMVDALVKAGVRPPDTTDRTGTTAGPAATHADAPPPAATAPSTPVTAPPPVPAAAAPAPGPSPRPAPEPPAPAALTDLLFAPMSWGEDWGSFDKLRVTMTLDGAWALSWEAPADRDADAVVLYRVVYLDHERPIAPEYGELVAVTQEQSVVFDRPFERAVRHLQVWSNTGSTPAEAALAQPRQVAAAELIAPVQEPAIGEEQGAVTGRWRSLPGTVEVQIFRIEPGRSIAGGLDPRSRILADEPSLGGFIDSTAERGRRYVYRVFAAARIDGVLHLSQPVVAPVSTSSVLEPVVDLRYSASRETAGRVEFDLSWTPPASGEVFVYRTVEGPLPGAEESPLPLTALAQTRLTEDDRVRHPVNALSAGTEGMRSVPWPLDWMRAYLTPVTVVDGTARVGKTISVTRLGRISDAELTERVFSQILTFSWPSGASSVLVFVAPPESVSAMATQGQPQVLTRQQWEQYGGHLFRQPLPSGGCRLHLMPVSFNGGQRVDGEVSTVDYDWLLRMRYTVETRRSALTRRRSTVLVGVTAERENECPPLVLVHNETRLPLDVGDGTPLSVTVESDDAGPATASFRAAKLMTTPGGVRWRASVAGLTGFIRVFVHLPTDKYAHVALLDPPVADLSLGS